MIKKIKMSLLTIAVLSTPLLAIEIKSPTHAVDIAGKQRMYTQRMLKDYAMVGMGNTFGNPDEDLKNITVDFQEHMESLAAYTKSEDVKKSIAKADALWKPLKKILSDVPSKDKVEKLQIDLDELLKATNETANLFAKESGKVSGEIVDKSGRQRMLSQRMASLYMLKVWKIDDPQFKFKLETTMKLFRISHDKLEKSDLNTDEIKTLLAKVKRSFMFFEMMSQSKSKYVPTLIYKKSNDILVNMNSATQKYVAIETK